MFTGWRGGAAPLGLVLMVASLSACSGEAGSPSSPVASTKPKAALSKDLCQQLDYAMVADGLGGKLLPKAPFAEQVEDFKLTCTQIAVDGSKHDTLGIQVTIISYDSPELAEAEAHGRALQASPAPTGSDYVYVDGDGSIKAGGRRGNILTEVRFFEVPRMHDDPILPGLAKEFRDLVMAKVTH